MGLLCNVNICMSSDGKAVQAKGGEFMGRYVINCLCSRYIFFFKQLFMLPFHQHPSSLFSYIIFRFQVPSLFVFRFELCFFFWGGWWGRGKENEGGDGFFVMKYFFWGGGFWKGGFWGGGGFMLDGCAQDFYDPMALYISKS